MTDADNVLFLVQSVSREKFPDNAKEMECLTLDWFIPVIEYRDSGSHKYIPKDKLNEKYKLPCGAGVYGYVSFADNSYLLRTCNDGLISWDANSDPV